MKAIYFTMLLLATLVFSCKEKTGKQEVIIAEVDDPIPFAGLETPFTSLGVNPLVDSVYSLSNGTRITIEAGALLDSLGQSITESVNISFRQFDDAVDIFLSGLPMELSSSNELVLQTAGMFEIQGVYKGQPILVDPKKPIQIDLASRYPDTRQGFFRLNPKGNNWELLDIPQAKMSDEYKELKEKIDNVKPYGPNYYVFDINSFGDVFREEDLTDSWSHSNDLAKEHLEKYGINTLGWSPYIPDIGFKNNNYSVGEMLWTSKKPIEMPYWAKDHKWTTDYNGDSVEIKAKFLSNNKYKFTVSDFNINKSFSFDLELVTHLRYILKYTPQQLLSKNKTIQKQIKENEKRIKRMRMVEYTVKIYALGTFNVDYPESFMSGNSIYKFTIDDKSVEDEEIRSITAFNGNLRSYIRTQDIAPNKCRLFPGQNKIVLITKKGQTGLLTGKAFNRLSDEISWGADTIRINLKGITVDSPEELRKLLKK